MSEWFESSTDDSDFYPIADLMSGLMAVFMCATVIILLNLKGEYTSRTHVQKNIIDEFHASIISELDTWNGEFFPNQAMMRFNSYFENREQAITGDFAHELDSFCPRLRQLLERYPKQFKEVRVEGHSSKQWRDPNEAFIGNMSVSQQRAVNTIDYCLKASGMKNILALRDMFTAVGMSYKVPINVEGKTDWNRSRRIEFVLVFNESDATLLEIGL